MLGGRADTGMGYGCVAKPSSALATNKGKAEYRLYSQIDKDDEDLLAIIMMEAA